MARIIRIALSISTLFPWFFFSKFSNNYSFLSMFCFLKLPQFCSVFLTHFFSKSLQFRSDFFVIFLLEIALFSFSFSSFLTLLISPNHHRYYIILSEIFPFFASIFRLFLPLKNDPDFSSFYSKKTFNFVSFFHRYFPTFLHYFLSTFRSFFDLIQTLQNPCISLHF